VIFADHSEFDNGVVVHDGHLVLDVRNATRRLEVPGRHVIRL
jgi:hypothetical protein